MEYHNENFNGEYDFRSRYHNGWQVGAHLHEYSEWLYCKSGSGMVTVNGCEILLSQNEMVFIPKNYVHQYDFPDAEVICAVFSNDFIPLFFRTVGNRYFCVRAVSAVGIADVLLKFPALSEGDALAACGHLNLIAAHILEKSEFEDAHPTDGILYQKVISYLSLHYAEEITLSGVARMFGYNEKYLSHALHSLTGIHFRQLLNFYRISHAKKLLVCEKSLTMSAIAAECGFGALNTFNREFKRASGITPTEYRKMR